jgi:hypothetical protein
MLQPDVKRTLDFVEALAQSGARNPIGTLQMRVRSRVHQTQSRMASRRRFRSEMDPLGLTAMQKGEANLQAGSKEQFVAERGCWQLRHHAGHDKLCQIHTRVCESSAWHSSRRVPRDRTPMVALVLRRVIGKTSQSM